METKLSRQTAAGHLSIIDYYDMPPLIDEDDVPASASVTEKKSELVDAKKQILKVPLSICPQQVASVSEVKTRSTPEEREMTIIHDRTQREVKDEQKHEDKDVKQSSLPLFLTAIRREQKQAIPDDFKRWHEWSRGEIVGAIVDKDFDRFKFFVGPAFDPILCRYENEMYVELDQAYFEKNCEELFYDRILQGIEIYINLKTTEKIIAKCEQKIGENKASDEVRQIVTKLKVAHEAVLKNVKQQGLEQYTEWYNKHLRYVEELRAGKLVDIASMGIPLAADFFISEIKAELESLLIKWTSPWMENEVQRLWSISDFVKEEVIAELKELQRRLIGSLLEAPNLFLLKEKAQQCPFVQRENREKKEDAYRKQIEIEKESYRKFAQAFLRQGKNRRFVKGFLLPSEHGSDKGLTDDNLIEMIVYYKFVIVPLYPDTDEVWLGRVFELVEKIDIPELRQKFDAELEKHCLHPRFKKALNEAKEVNDVAKKVRKQLIREASSAELEMKYVIPATLEARIHAPLTEFQLQLILDTFPCQNQRQILLKKLLRDYLDNNFGDDLYPRLRSYVAKKKSIERRRQVEYLISSLYSAQTDESYLFNQSAEDEMLVGVNLISDQIGYQQEKYTWLQKKFYYSWLFELLQKLLSRDEFKSDVSKEEAPAIHRHKQSSLVRFSLCNPKIIHQARQDFPKVKPHS